MSNWGDFDEKPFDVPCGYEYNTMFLECSAVVQKGFAEREKIVKDIMLKIPAGCRYDSMERLETKDGEIIVRINTKKENQ